MLGPTKDAEYRAAIAGFEAIYREQGLYFALAFLYDSGYGREDIHKMMLLLEKKEQA